MRKRTLKAVRKRAKLTQQQLETKSGVAQGIISKIESGKIQRPAYDTVEKLAEALEIDPRTLKFGLPDEVAV